MNFSLLVSAFFTAIAALLHLGCIYFGAPWYRFFGAGEQMAQMAEQGSSHPTIVTLFIFTVLSVWTAYALSGAGVIRKLPLRKLALCLIMLIFFVRAIAGFYLITEPIGRTPMFWFWSSVICLSFALGYGYGVKQQWRQL